jgi:hypothetical protein
MERQLATALAGGGMEATGTAARMERQELGKES